MGFKQPLTWMILLAAMTAGGCASGTDTPGVATAGGAPSAVASADAVAAYIEGVRAYVKCLRNDGVKVTDPDAKGTFTFEGDLALLKQDEKFAAAQDKCRNLLPAAPAGLRDKPVRTAEQIEMIRKYAKCMRENGAPDFPDPGQDGYLPDRGNGRASWNQDTHAARQAARTCAPIIGDPTIVGEGIG